MIGSIAVVAIYILYYVGLTGGVANAVMMENGQEGAKLAFETVFTRAGGALLFVFVIISCLGTLNGLMLGCTRGMYSLAVRNEGPLPELFKQVDPVTNMPTNSSILGLFFCGLWLLYFYGAIIMQIAGEAPWFGLFSFDTSELPIVTLYASYIPIFIAIMIKEKALGGFRRFLMPLLSLFGCVFMVIAAIYAHGRAVLYYFVVFLVFMLIGVFFSRKKENV